jgi:hypothetical protein
MIGRTMMGVVLLAALLFLALAIYIALRAKPRSEDSERHQAEDYRAMLATRYPDSDAFDAAFEKHIASHTDKYFSTKIAGATFPNSDGSSRPSIIKKCEPMELLRLEHEPDNLADPMTIAVKRVDGSQLGYLDRRVASDLHRDTGKPYSWSALFKQANHHPETDEVVGAVIVLTRSKIDAPEAD